MAASKKKPNKCWFDGSDSLGDKCTAKLSYYYNPFRKLIWMFCSNPNHNGIDMIKIIDIEAKLLVIVKNYSYAEHQSNR